MFQKKALLLTPKKDDDSSVSSSSDNSSSWVKSLSPLHLHNFVGNKDENDDASHSSTISSVHRTLLGLNLWQNVKKTNLAPVYKNKNDDDSDDLSTISGKSNQSSYNHITHNNYRKHSASLSICKQIYSIIKTLYKLRRFMYLRNRKFSFMLLSIFLIMTIHSNIRSTSKFKLNRYDYSTNEIKQRDINDMSDISDMKGTGEYVNILPTDYEANELYTQSMPDENPFLFETNLRTKQKKKKIDPSVIVSQFQDENHVYGGRGKPAENKIFKNVNDIENLNVLDNTVDKKKKKMDPSFIISQFQDEKHVYGSKGKPSQQHQDDEQMYKHTKKYNPADIINQFRDGHNESKDIDNYTDKPDRLDPNEILNQFQFGNNGDQPIHKVNKKYDPSDIINQFRDEYQRAGVKKKQTLDEEAIQELGKLQKLHYQQNQVKMEEQDMDESNDADESDSINPLDIINQFQFGNNGEKKLKKPKKKYNPASIVEQFQEEKFHNSRIKDPQKDSNEKMIHDKRTQNKDDDDDQSAKVDEGMSLAAAVEAELNANANDGIDENSMDGDENTPFDPIDIINQFQFGNNGKEINYKKKKKYNPADVINQFQVQHDPGKRIVKSEVVEEDNS